MAQSAGASVTPLAREGYGRHARLATDLVKYAFASVAALATDFGVLMLCHKLLGVNALAAAGVGFICGLGVVYWLSVHYVFGNRRRLEAGPEFVGFLVTGVLGLMLNEALMALFTAQFGFSVVYAKIPTAGLVFAFQLFYAPYVSVLRAAVGPVGDIARLRALMSDGRPAEPPPFQTDTLLVFAIRRRK